MTEEYLYNHEWIARQLPHSGDMCLLDGVERYDDDEIQVITRSHLRADNPMRVAGRLGIAVGIEYAAQAMAIHCALLQPPRSKPSVGYLASLRDVHFEHRYLDTGDAALQIIAKRVSGNETTGLYRFEVVCDGELLLHGRAAVLVTPGDLAQWSAT